jgi:RimJ/RimL family protein N-acetyltransferase
MEKSIAPGSATPLPHLRLRPADSPDLLRLVAGWLAEPDNAKWLDFGDGRLRASAEWLKIAMQRGALAVRVFDAEDGTPIGAAGLGDINPHFKTAHYWVVLGDKRYAGRGYASLATSRMLTVGFSELGLRAIQTWIVEHNPSVAVARRARFRPIGRQRQCHVIDGRPYDRLLFDILAEEHQEL